MKVYRRPVVGPVSGDIVIAWSRYCARRVRHHRAGNGYNIRSARHHRRRHASTATVGAAPGAPLRATLQISWDSVDGTALGFYFPISC